MTQTTTRPAEQTPFVTALRRTAEWALSLAAILIAAALLTKVWHAPVAVTVAVLAVYGLAAARWADGARWAVLVVGGTVGGMSALSLAAAVGGDLSGLWAMGKIAVACTAASSLIAAVPFLRQMYAAAH